MARTTRAGSGKSRVVAKDDPNGLFFLSCVSTQHADVAQLVEHNLAKVGVASSNLVIRSQQLL